MKIQSNFKDCYDGIFSYSPEDTLVYKRFKSDVFKNHVASFCGGEADLEYSTKDLIPFLDSRPVNLSDFFIDKNSVYSYSLDIELVSFKIAFCGVIYSGVRLVLEGNDSLIYNRPSDQCFYSLDSMVDFLKSKGITPRKKDKDSFLDIGSIHSLTSLFDKPWDHHKEDFIKKKIVILALEKTASWGIDWKLSKDCCLNNFKFQKVLDPNSIAQEISMYIGGILAPENRPMVEVSDKDRLIQHGFDKFSFKKLPTKRR